MKCTDHLLNRWQVEPTRALLAERSARDVDPVHTDGWRREVAVPLDQHHLEVDGAQGLSDHGACAFDVRTAREIEELDLDGSVVLSSVAHGCGLSLHTWK